MKNLKYLFCAFAIPLLFTSCQSKSDEEIALENTVKLDSALTILAEPSQKFSVSSNDKVLVMGNRGTIIHIEPANLAFLDSSEIVEDIEIELVEMTEKSDLIYHNAQTVSNNKLLISGGAYYLNMTSGGKQLKIVERKKLEVEFPKISDKSMELFVGERDKLGIMNWIPTKNSFVSKNIKDAIKPQKQTGGKRYIPMEALIDFLKNNDSTYKKREEKQQREHEAIQKQIDFQRKTYEQIGLSNFGFINCDKYVAGNRPIATVELKMNKEIELGSNFYFVFKNMNSIISKCYYKSGENLRFENIPEGETVTIIGLSHKDESINLFQKEIVIKDKSIVSVKFEPSSLEEIKKVTDALN